MHRTPRDVLNHAVARSIETKPHLLVLDEVNNAVYHGFLESREVLMSIRSLPKETNVVLTGRYAPPEFLDAADLVTLMLPMKHYYRKGYVGIRGLEW
jgi:cob(I)alamin adenosyltransferase